MENVKGYDQRSLIIKELLNGIQIAQQLRKQILRPSDNKEQISREEQGFTQSLMEQMLSSFDKTISMAKSMGVELPTNHHHIQSDSSHSLNLASQSSRRHLHVSKKRKMSPRWTKEVKVGSGGSRSEGPLDDGFGWRKYGQKDILGAKNPRGYFRCTHRHSQGCTALKQVQRSDEDSSIFHVTYRGEHTCIQGGQVAKAQTKPSPAQIKAKQSELIPAQQQEHQSPPQEVYQGIGPDEDLKHEPIERENEAQIFRSFSFTSALLETAPPENYLLSYSPGFSPATSESNPFSLSPYRVSGFGAGLNVQTSDSDLNEVLSGPNSVTNSPTVGNFEFPLDQLADFNATFPFEF